MLIVLDLTVERIKVFIKQLSINDYMTYQLEYIKYLLKHKYTFRISRGARNETPTMLIMLTFNGVSGFGEASMPPLYGESHETAVRFLKKLDLSSFNNPFDIEGIMSYVDQIDNHNTAIKCAIDMALHDIASKLQEIPCYEYLGLKSCNHINTSKTIGIDEPEIVQERVLQADQFNVLKVKLGTENDKPIVEAIRKVTDKPLYVDANQGWLKKEHAVEMIDWLSERNVVMIEQPMPVDCKKELNWLKGKSKLPVIGDESIQRLVDVEQAEQFYHGINIKLVKSTGLHEAMKMINLAKNKHLKIMIGCMAETSCSISAAFNLSAAADYVDLDGNLGITNDPFSGVNIYNGQLVRNQVSGIGLVNAKEHWDALKANL